MTRAMPMDPPIIPPTAWRPTHPRTPPQLTKATAGMKYVPMTKPATAADSKEMENNEMAVKDDLLKQTLYLASQASASKKTLAAVKPRKKRPAGLKMKFMEVAMRPTAVAAPGFLTHHTVRESTAKPIISQRIGRLNTLNTIGEKMELNTPQRADNKAMAATSRLL